ncbi:unnamed protein product [Ectocarpus fasciculatus]
MWSLLKMVTVAICAQVSAGQVLIQVKKGTIPSKNFKSRGFDSALQEHTKAEGFAETEHAIPHVENGKHSTVATDHGAIQPHRKLFGFCLLVIVILVATTTPAYRRMLQSDTEESDTEEMVIAVDITITDPVNGATVYPVEVSVAADGLAEADIPLTFSDQTNDEDTGLCDECTVSFVAGECLSGPCDTYDMYTTNDNMEVVSSVCGDPHMVGLLGQKIAWYGEDNGWYCLLDDSAFQINARVTAPLPEEFPNRQLLSGVSLLTADGHSLVIEVKNPYSIATKGCPSHACLADGSLRILVDGHESESLQTPGEDIVLPGDVVVSSANLPVECRPFGGDRIWAAQRAAMDTAIDHRSLRGHTPFVDWLLASETMVSPAWCAKFVRGNGPAGMSEVQSNHAIFRIETPTVTIRVNIGINYQDSKTDGDGSVLIPELEFWQTDLAFEGLQTHGEAGGMLGDTSNFVYDNDGVPITRGMGALHAPVKNYRVSGPLGIDFEQQHKGK